MRARRALVRAVVFGLIGTMISAAVAWAFAIWEPPRSQMTFNIGFEESRGIFAARIPSGQYADRLATTDRWPPDLAAMGMDVSPGAPQIYLIQGTRGQGHGYLFTSVTDHLSQLPAHVVEFQAGWPLLCLRGARWSEQGATQEDGLRLLSSRWHWLTPGSRGWKLIPLHPIWTGLIVNSMLYGSLAWLLSRIPGALRRRWRARRGRCSRCGYDLRGGGSQCPECGTPARRT